MPAFLDPLMEWMRAHPGVLQGLSIFGVASFVASLVLVPWILARLPVNHFVHAEAHVPDERRDGLWWLLRVLRNGLGVVLLVGGLAMLVLPGQGLLTLLIALGLLDVPGKRRVERALLRRPSFLRAVNWMRRRGGAPDLLPPVFDEPD